MNKAILLLLALLCIAGGATILAIGFGMKTRTPDVEARTLVTIKSADPPPAPRAKDDVPAEWLHDFTLTERNGKKFESKDMAGKVWAASFFFADCPGECHQQNQAIAGFQKEMGPKGVTFVSITVNPERDTAARLREYAANYTKSADQWLFLTGDDIGYIRRIGEEFFGVVVDKGTHGSRLILVDKWGNMRGYYSTSGTRLPEEYAAIRPKLKELLAETEPPKEFKKEGAASDSAHEEGKKTEE